MRCFGILLITALGGLSLPLAVDAASEGGAVVPNGGTTPPGASAGVKHFAPLEGIERLRGDLYVIRGQGGTSLVWVYSQGVLLVDAKLPRNGAKIQELIRTVTDKPLTHLVITHAHGDHTGSSPELPANVEIIAQENTARHMRGQERYRLSAAGLPTRTFKDRLTLFTGKDRVELYYFGAAHTDGDALVVFPAVRIMHSGDVMKKKELPTIDPEFGGSGTQFAATVHRIVANIHGVDGVVGGHNDDLMTWGDFKRFAHLASSLLDYEKHEWRAGRTPEQTLAGFRLPAGDEDFTLEGSTFGGLSAVQNTFAELQAGGQ